MRESGAWELSSELPFELPVDDLEASPAGNLLLIDGHYNPVFSRVFVPGIRKPRPWGDLEERLSPEPLEVRRIELIAMALRSNDTYAVSFRGACSALARTVARPEWDNERAMYLAQAIECALLGSEDKGDRTARFAEAVAQRLGRCPRDRDKLRRSARLLYDNRSKWVHTVQSFSSRSRNGNSSLDDLLPRLHSLLREELRQVARDLVPASAVTAVLVPDA
jgi:hypothetical protein